MTSGQLRTAAHGTRLGCGVPTTEIFTPFGLPEPAVARQYPLAKQA